MALEGEGDLPGLVELIQFAAIWRAQSAWRPFCWLAGRFSLGGNPPAMPFRAAQVEHCTPLSEKHQGRTPDPELAKGLDAVGDVPALDDSLALEAVRRDAGKPQGASPVGPSQGPISSDQIALCNLSVEFHAEVWTKISGERRGDGNTLDPPELHSVYVVCKVWGVVIGELRIVARKPLRVPIGRTAALAVAR